MLNFCRCPSIRLTVPGGTRLSVCLLPPAVSVIRMIFVILLTSSIRPAFLLLWIGFPPIFPKTVTDLMNLTAPICMSMPIPERENTPTGERRFTTTAVPKSLISCVPAPSTGSRSFTLTAFASTRLPLCSTLTTPAKTASGFPTFTAAMKT